MVGNGPFTGPLGWSNRRSKSTVGVCLSQILRSEPLFFPCFLGICIVCHHYDVSSTHLWGRLEFQFSSPFVKTVAFLYLFQGGKFQGAIPCHGGRCKDTSTACTNMKLVLAAQHQSWHSVDIHTASDTQTGDTHA